MSKDKNNKPLVPLTPADLRFITKVLTAGNASMVLLSNFERKFVKECTERYREVGARFQVRGKQMQVFQEIGVKLGIEQEEP